MKHYKHTLPAMIFSLLFVSACQSTSNRENTEEFFDSAAISTNVKLRILQEKSLNVIRVNASTVKGVVTLTGIVKNRAAKEKATELAESVKGVTKVINKLAIATQ